MSQKPEQDQTRDSKDTNSKTKTIIQIAIIILLSFLLIFLIYWFIGMMIMRPHNRRFAEEAEKLAGPAAQNKRTFLGFGLTENGDQDILKVVLQTPDASGNSIEKIYDHYMSINGEKKITLNELEKLGYRNLTSTMAVPLTTSDMNGLARALAISREKGPAWYERATRIGRRDDYENYTHLASMLGNTMINDLKKQKKEPTPLGNFIWLLADDKTLKTIRFVLDTENSVGMELEQAKLEIKKYMPNTQTPLKFLNTVVAKLPIAGGTGQAYGGSDPNPPSDDQNQPATQPPDPQPVSY